MLSSILENKGAVTAILIFVLGAFAVFSATMFERNKQSEIDNDEQDT